MYTLKELRERKSVRGYTDESLSESIRNTLNAEATFINSHEAGLNFQVRYDDADPFGVSPGVMACFAACAIILQ